MSWACSVCTLVNDAPLAPACLACRSIRAPTAAAILRAFLVDDAGQPLRNATPDVLEDLAAARSTTAAVAANDDALLVAGGGGALVHLSGERRDAGWGCGYRNIQMVLCALRLAPRTSGHIAATFARLPTIAAIQDGIERAWAHGFDEMGAQQLQGRLVGTSTWIGTTEAICFLRDNGVACRLIDVDRPRPGAALVEYVRAYFARAGPDALPIYLQHAGHSRTIVGVERSAAGVDRVLCLDPGRPYARAAGPYRLSAHQLDTQRQYSLLIVDGIGEPTDADKVLASVRL